GRPAGRRRRRRGAPGQPPGAARAGPGHPPRRGRLRPGAGRDPNRAGPSRSCPVPRAGRAGAGGRHARRPGGGPRPRRRRGGRRRRHGGGGAAGQGAGRAAGRARLMAVLVVKLGTSTLLDGAGRIREEVLDARVRELVRVARQGHQPVLVSSGAVGCGLGVMGITERPALLPDLQAASAIGQGVLFERYLRAFGPLGVTPAQVLLTSGDLERRASYLNARNTLGRLLEWGIVPVINENDTTAADGVTFGDNDVLAAQVAILLRASWLLLLTDREGLYGEGPDGPGLIRDVPAGAAPPAHPPTGAGPAGPRRGRLSGHAAPAHEASARARTSPP